MKDATSKAQAKRLRSYLRTEASVRVDMLLDEALPALEAALDEDPQLDVWSWARSWMSQRIQVPRGAAVGEVGGE